MKRYEFLKSLGFTGGALMAALASCTKEADSITQAVLLVPNANSSTTSGSTTTAPAYTTITGNVTTEALNAIKNVLVSIDLTASNNASLVKTGGYIISKNIVIAQIASSKFAAVTVTCSHEPKKKVIFRNGEFYCTDHGARYNTAGKGLNSLGSKGITAYKVATDGKTLVVYS